MTKKTGSKMGSDPLAWMREDSADADVTEAPITEAPKAPAKKSATRRKRRGARKPAAAARAPAGQGASTNEADVALLEQSFQLLSPHGEKLVARFYEVLFERHPQVKPLFAGVNMREQQGKLLAALKLTLKHLREPEALAGVLAELGARHERYGARPEHYPAVAKALLDVMAEVGGDDWNVNFHEAWSGALEKVTELMLDAYGNVEANNMATQREIVEDKLSASAQSQEAVRMFSAVNNALTAIMMVDRDLVITYVNRATQGLLNTHAGVFREIFPGFDPSNMVGQCVDQFHKNPQHQRQLLSNPANMPYQTDIKVGPLTFSLNVTCIIDDKGEYLGNTLEWADVSEQRAKENDVARLSGAIDGAMTAMMMVDRDLKITYVNQATVDLLDKHSQTMRSLFPGFDAHNMLGVCIDDFHKNPAHQRQLLSNPNNFPYQTDIRIGPLTISLNVTAIRDTKGEYIGNTLEWSDVTEQRAQEREVARLQSAVEGATTALMLCDQDLKITFVNPAVVELLANRQEQLRRVFPGFDARNLIGRCIDDFHKNPAHQRSLLSDPSRLPFRSEIKLLDLEFEVNATAIVDAQGKFMGNMVEWKDITEQKDAERQIETIIEAATRGDLDQRIDAERYEGFARNVGEGVNALLDAMVVPLKEGVRVLKELAEGNLREDMSGEYEGEFAALRDAIDTSMGNLRNMVGNILSATSSIAKSSSEIAQGNADLSQRTEEQASSLEQTASSMEEMTSTVKQSADNARQANQLATGARDQAEKGGDVVGKAVSAMAEINSSSKKIADIIGVIDEIAFQTNLLALNAAVEAARAGEQGRGFAVVAAEVRNLAQRSATAAKEIKSLIKDSVEKVEEGSRLVDDSGKTLGEIVEAVKRVSDIIAEIAAASSEQSAGIEQVNKAITQLDEVTQQNAALVEEAAASSQSLDEQARNMSELMDFFSVDDTPSPVQSRGPAQERDAAPRAPAQRVQSRRRPPAPRAGSNEDDEWEEF